MPKREKQKREEERKRDKPSLPRTLNHRAAEFNKAILITMKSVLPQPNTAAPQDG